MKNRSLALFLSTALTLTGAVGYLENAGTLAYTAHAAYEEYLKPINANDDGAFSYGINLSGAYYEGESYNYYSTFVMVLDYASNTAKDWDISVSDTSVIRLEDDQDLNCNEGDDLRAWVYFNILKAGKATVTIKHGGKSYKIPVIINNTDLEITSFKSTPKGNLTLNWKKQPKADGYIIYKGDAYEEYYGANWKAVKTVSGNATTKATVASSWGEKAAYHVVGYQNLNGKALSPTVNELDSVAKVIKTSEQGSQITSVKKSGKKSLKVTFQSAGKNAAYKLYRSTNEKSGYKLIKDIPASTAKTISYTDKVTKGKVYHYRVKTIIGGKTSKASSSVSSFVPVGGKRKFTDASKVHGAFDQVTYSVHAAPENSYYYVQGSSLKKVSCNVNSEKSRLELKIDTFDKNAKYKSTKTVKIKGIDFGKAVYGGTYHAADGYNYVVIGFMNFSEKKNAVVFKVQKYNKSWKKVKTLSITSKQISYSGIQYPTLGGSLRMDMSGSTLYVHTCAQHFMSSDGKRHQWSEAFQINTKTMKLVKNPYTLGISHSFNQFAKFKDGSLYCSDQGDAYPRGIEIVGITNYKDYDNYDGFFMTDPFTFKGEPGDNNTGATLDGLEVGQKYIISTGVSVPHGKAVKGVKGFKETYNKNLYLILTDRYTGKSTFKWLTSYDPKTSKYTVTSARLVKITDNSFAIIYNLYNNKTGFDTMHIMFIDGSGKVVLKKSYKGYSADMSAQPVMFNGYVTLMVLKEDPKNYYGTFKMMRIPAV